MTGTPDVSTDRPAPSPDNTVERRVAEVDPAVDPAALTDDPRVTVAERAYPHEDADHCEADAAARGVVGLTRDDGAVLLLVHEETGHALLPHPVVGPEEDLLTAAREEAADVANTAVSIDGAVAVRRVEHYVADPDTVGATDDFEPPADATPHNVTHHVVLAASVPADATAPDDGPGVDDPDWAAGWFHEVPVDLADEDGDAIADIRRFLD